jgi:prepilin-type N-terminal cleavage/methylation domain-containing protein
MRGRHGPPPHRPNGFSLLECVFVVALLLILMGTTVPSVLTALDRIRTVGAARYIATRMALARSDAVARAATVALRFGDGPDQASITAFIDGNRNGVRTADILAGSDPSWGPAASVSDLFPGVLVDLPVNAHPLYAFTPLGTSSSGTIVVRGRDGSRFGVRVLGATGRTRVLRYDAARDQWVDLP